MSSIENSVHRAALMARSGNTEEALAAIDAARTAWRKVQAPNDPGLSKFLDYLASMGGLAQGDPGEALCAPDIGDVASADVAVVAFELLRWTDSLWVTDARVASLRRACEKGWLDNAPRLAVGLSATARNHARQVRLTEAANASRESVALWRELSQERGDGAYEGRNADALRLLGAIESTLGNHAEASAAAAESCRRFRVLCQSKRGHFVAPWASALHNLAGARLGLADVGGAASAIRASIALRREMSGLWPSLFLSDLAESLLGASRIFLEADLCEEAASASAEAVELAIRLSDEGGACHADLLMGAMKTRARSAMAAGDWQKGLAAADAEIVMLRNCVRRDGDLAALALAEALHNRATFLTMLGDDANASASVGESIRLQETLGGAPSVGALVNVAASLHLAGKLAARSGDLEGAAQWFKQAMQIRCDRTDGASYRSEADVTQSCIELARVSAKLGRLGDAAAATETATVAMNAAVKRSANAESLGKLARGLLQLGNLRRKLGDMEAAIAAYRKAASLGGRLRAFGASDAMAIAGARKLISFLKRSGRGEEGEAWRQRLGLNDTA